MNVASVPRKDGQPIPGPLVIPAVSHGKLAWAQSALSGNAELHLYSLVAGSDRVISQGHFGMPAFAWPWHSGDPKATWIFAAPSGDVIQWHHIGDHIITWVGAQASYAADLRTLAVAQMTPKYGSIQTKGTGLVVNYPVTAVKSSHHSQQVFSIDVSGLPSLPGCAPSR